ncbi:hypothetical protein V6Z12_A01G166600 [Gossypium hirsutum]
MLFTLQLLIGGKVSLLAPSTPAVVFTSDMICEATIDRIVELLELKISAVSKNLCIGSCRKGRK